MGPAKKHATAERVRSTSDMRAVPVMPKKVVMAKALPPMPKMKFKAALLATQPLAASASERSEAAARVSERLPTKKQAPKQDPELDTASRAAALLGPPPIAQQQPLADARGCSDARGCAVPSATSSSTIPQLATELLEKAAFWGDGHRGVARLRFGKTARNGLAGASVTLEHDGDTIALRVDECTDPSVIDRLREQLAARGIELRES
jgi:hypothetical protein